jgi:aerobic-type carbon monoxide dehydrogenase small subunit (CoxS/CutS family)
MRDGAPPIGAGEPGTSLGRHEVDVDSLVSLQHAAERVGAQKVLCSFVVNGEPVEAAIAPNATLLEALREDLGLTGTKHGCELGECGTCTVIIDGAPVLSCLVLAIAARGQAIETVEGLARGGAMHPLQDAFADLGAAQCGYCTPGFLLSAKALLERDASPSRAAIEEALSGNLCRCTGYLKIYEAVEMAASRLRARAAAAEPATGTTIRRTHGN